MIEWKAYKHGELVQTKEIGIGNIRTRNFKFGY